MRRIITSVFILLLVASHDLAGQTPSATAKAFFQAHTDKQWSTMASFVDSASLRALRGTSEKMAAMFAAASKPEMRATMDSIGAPGLARAMDGIQSMLGTGSMLQFMFARVTDAGALSALTDQELMGRWFEAKSFGYIAEMTTGGMLKGMLEKMPATASAGLQAELDKIRSMRLAWDVVGATVEGDSVAHVVYRVAGVDPAGPTGVLTFRGSGGRWLIHFTDPDDQLAPMNALAMRAAQSKFPR